MLSHLEVDNLALIKNCSLDFYPGLTCISGETGAGKSLLLTAVKAITGSRLSSDLLGRKDKELKVSAQFTQVERYLPPEILQEFCGADPAADTDKDTDTETDTAAASTTVSDFADADLIITRKLNVAMRNRIYINNELTNLSYLRKLGTYLADIHSQNEQQDLADPNKHLIFLDNYAGLEVKTLKTRLQELYSCYQEKKRALQHLIADPAKRESALRKMQDIVNEIKQADFSDSEIDDLYKRRQKYQQLENLLHYLQTAEQALNSDFGDSENSYSGSISKELLRCRQALDKAAQISPKLQTLSQECGRLTEEMNNLELEITHYLHNLPYNEQEVTLIDKRLNVLQNLVEKYAPQTGTLAEVRAYGVKLQEKIRLLNDTEESRIKLVEETTELWTTMSAIAAELHEKRRQAAGKLEAAVCKVAGDLALPDLRFAVNITADANKLQADGYDRAEILLAANLGGELKPLARIASGGESSRIFLALKVILADIYKVPLLLFDEIDQGISGAAAQAVAGALKKLSRTHQVICISHQATIVAQADNVYQVYKSSDREANTTASCVKHLDESEIVAELTRLLAGESDMQEAVKLAKALRHDALQVRE